MGNEKTLKHTKAYTRDDWFYECPNCGELLEDRREDKDTQCKCNTCKEIFIVEEPDESQIDNAARAKWILDNTEDPVIPLADHFLDSPEIRAEVMSRCDPHTGEPVKEKVPHCTLTYYDGWALCSNCKGEWVENPRVIESYKYCRLCGARVVPTEETLTEILTSDRLIDARLESEITEDPKMVSMAEDGLKELLEMGIELGISEAFKSIGLKMGPPIKRIGENVEQKHAGLGDGKLNLITFNDTEQLRVMLIAIGFSIDDKDIVYHQGKPVICSSCERELTLDEIGYVMPPAHFYCSSDVCICDYFERYGWPDENKPPTEEPFVLDYETFEKDVRAHGGPINHRDTLMEE